MPGRNGLSSKAIKPIKSATDLLLWQDQSNKIRRSPVGPALVAEPLHLALRSRVQKPYRGQKHRNGKYWVSQIEQSIWHDSMLERWALMFLDFTADVIAVTAQPCLLQYTDGTHHYPDYFVVYGDGRRSLIDVHFTGLDNEATLNQFRRTQDACHRIGWSYEMFRTVDPIVLRNVELLSMYRHPMYAPPENERDALARAFDRLPFCEAVEVDKDVPTALTTCRIYHMIWVGDLTADLTVPLGDYTILRSN
ncbi:hypothetical protein ASE16_02070 [Leifsonia sp. Root227]|uniref:TnsA-like heteromeric transposase endonuclease subunit n=1 Tax=Leifsonia sp. Root227 TaxID=1736496 RepID=UPI0006FEF5AE|nr:TnsA-like heteromeric transposase endonuclease subunit [Leifsonia sp. Root227]KRC51879.1 hypothetical protein ASE16_02070 [Leifsonia sp. Root227]